MKFLFKRDFKELKSYSKIISENLKFLLIFHLQGIIIELQTFQLTFHLSFYLSLLTYFQHTLYDRNHKRNIFNSGKPPPFEEKSRLSTMFQSVTFPRKVSIYLINLRVEGIWWGNGVGLVGGWVRRDR